MSGPYGANDAPGTGEGRNNDPTQQWGAGQPAPGSADPTQHQQWSGQPAQPQWGQQPAQPGQPGWQPQPAPQWGQQQPSQPSWPQQQPAGTPWEATQQQWGQQPPQPQQQWGQPQPQQWGDQQQGQPQQSWDQQQVNLNAPKKSRLGLIIAGVLGLVVVIVVVIVAAVVLSGDKLDNKAVQDGVQKVLKDSYGIDDVQNVSCPSGQKVKVGSTFDCSLKVGGDQKKVTVKVTKSDGTYEVGRPS